MARFLFLEDEDTASTPYLLLEFGSDAERPEGCPKIVKCSPECKISPFSKNECEKCICPPPGSKATIPSDGNCPRVFCRKPDCITITVPETGCQECACVAPEDEFALYEFENGTSHSISNQSKTVSVDRTPFSTRGRTSASANAFSKIEKFLLNSLRNFVPLRYLPSSIFLLASFQL